MRVDESRLINPGLFRHQIIWRQKNPTGSQDSFGQPVIGAPIAFVSCKAQVKPLQGRELDVARQLFAEARYRIYQWKTPGLEREMWIEWYIDGQVKTLDVLDIQDHAGVGRFQEIIAKDHVE